VIATLCLFRAFRAVKALGRFKDLDLASMSITRKRAQVMQRENTTAVVTEHNTFTERVGFACYAVRCCDTDVWLLS
jgi:hypothetical protein